ncbi:8752_t:CDS:2, partial [Racocetra fulgida]
EERRAITRDELKLICFIINTADYCYVTTSQLEDKLKDTIDEEYKEKINFDEERNHFLNVVTTSVRALIRGIESSYDPALVAMTKLPWRISKVETILKTVLTPHDPPEGLVENYILLIADKNISNFQKILDIKGIKKNEQQPLIEIFQQKILEHPKLLENSNIMSSLTSSATSITSAQLSQFITPLPSSFLNNVPLAAGENKFNAVNIKKVLSGRNWRKKDGDGTKKEDDKV